VRSCLETGRRNRRRGRSPARRCGRDRGAILLRPRVRRVPRPPAAGIARWATPMAGCAGKSSPRHSEKALATHLAASTLRSRRVSELRSSGSAARRMSTVADDWTVSLQLLDSELRLSADVSPGARAGRWWGFRKSVKATRLTYGVRQKAAWAGRPPASVPSLFWLDKRPSWTDASAATRQTHSSREVGSRS